MSNTPPDHFPRNFLHLSLSDGLSKLTFLRSWWSLIEVSIGKIVVARLNVNQPASCLGSFCFLKPWALRASPGDTYVPKYTRKIDASWGETPIKLPTTLVPSLYLRNGHSTHSPKRLLNYSHPGVFFEKIIS